MPTITLSKSSVASVLSIMILLLNACGGSESTPMNVCTSQKMTLNDIHLKIDGDGLFILSDENQTEERYTRKGEFCVDEKGTIKHASGDTMIMTLANENGSFIGQPDALAKIDLENKGAALTSLSVDENGILTGQYDSDETALLGQIRLARFNSPQNLKAADNDRCKETEDSGRPILGNPNNGGLGNIQSGTLEGQYECDRGSGLFNTQLTIQGESFFRLSHADTTLYAKTIKIGGDKNGILVNASGHHVSGYAANSIGQILDELVILDMSSTTRAPQSTDSIRLAANLNADSSIPSNPTFDAADTTSYTHQTAISIFDSLGNAHALTFYFLKTNLADTWELYSLLNPTSVSDNDGELSANGLSPLVLTFNTDGTIASPISVFFEDFDPSGGAVQNQIISLNLSALTQNMTSFEVASATQNGWAAGSLTRISFSENGLILGHFSNSLTNITLGEFALATFPDPEGLQAFDTTTFVETTHSGPATLGTASTSEFGRVVLSGSN